MCRDSTVLGCDTYLLKKKEKQKGRKEGKKEDVHSKEVKEQIKLYCTYCLCMITINEKFLLSMIYCCHEDQA